MASTSLTAGLAPEFTWNFSQVFGDKVVEGEICEADIISALQFSHDGDYLATGDKGGRVVLFERNTADTHGESAEYRFYTEFQSHEPEFDYLKSLEIEEKINQICWLRRKHQAHFLLSTNDKTIKLWKVFERTERAAVDPASSEGAGDDEEVVRIPRLLPVRTYPEARLKRVFANAHAYHINSISMNSDEETFLSADDLRIHLWHHGVSDQSFNIVDIKPPSMDDLAEVITAARFHPHHCNLFVYSSSRGNVRLGDMRASALCDSHAKLFEEPTQGLEKTFFTEILSSISDLKFSHDGRFFLTRDYMNVRVWDINMERQPVQTFKIHDHFRPKLCTLYENDCVFDKFEACFSGDDNFVLSGSYNGLFKICQRSTQRSVMLEAAHDAIEGPHHVLIPMNILPGDPPRQPRPSRADAYINAMDVSRKILHMAWHPTRPIMAIAAVNNLFLFRQNAALHR